MKKRKSSKTIRPQFELLSVNYSNFSRSQWNFKSLKAGYWRLYHHDAYGGGVILNGKNIELSPDYVYLIPPNVTFDTWCKNPLIQLTIHFEMNSLAGHQNPIFALKTTVEIQRLLKNIDLIFKKKFNLLSSRIYAIALAAHCLTLLPEKVLCEQKHKDVRISEICDWMDNFNSETASVGLLAKTVGINKTTLTRRFKKETGDTPYHFLMKRRYEYAEKLLKTTNYTLGEICNIIGVNDPFNFSRTFKRIYGISPSAFRKSEGKSQKKKKSFQGGHFKTHRQNDLEMIFDEPDPVD